MNDRINRPELPKGWTWTTLSEISEVNLGKTPNKAQYRNHGDYKIIKFRDIIGDKIDWDDSDRGFVVNSHDLIVQLRELRERDVLVTASAHSSEHIGKKAVYVSSIPLNYNKVFFVGELLCIRADEEIVNPRIIYYYIISQDGYNSIQSHVRGVHLISSEARQIGIPLPPLPEQHRIITKIEELLTRLDAGVEGLKKVKAQLRRYRQAVLKHAFEGKLTEEWREAHKGQIESVSVLLGRIREERRRNTKGKFKELPPLDTSDLPELPEGWVWTRIGDICNLINGRAFKPKEWSTDGLPIIRIQNLNDVNADFNYCNFRIEEKYVVNSGQLLFAWSGTPRTSFGAHLWNRGRAVLNQHIFNVEIQEDCLNKTFLMHLLNWNVTGFIRQAHGTAGLAHITKGKFEDSIVCIPPFLEQQKIVEEIERRFSVADAIEKDVEQSLRQAERLRQSILKRAFEGKLVPQDPTDEPAEKLLERIRAEKAERG